MSNVFLYLILGLLILLLIIGVPCFVLFLIYLVMELVDDWKTIDWPESK